MSSSCYVWVCLFGCWFITSFRTRYLIDAHDLTMLLVSSYRRTIIEWNVYHVLDRLCNVHNVGAAQVRVQVRRQWLPYRRCEVTARDARGWRREGYVTILLCISELTTTNQITWINVVQDNTHLLSRTVRSERSTIPRTNTMDSMRSSTRRHRTTTIMIITSMINTERETVTTASFILTLICLAICNHNTCTDNALDGIGHTTKRVCLLQYPEML